MRKLFNDNWQFALMSLDGIPVESNYKSVDIPHDWQIYNTHDLYSTGDGFYRKRFTLTDISGKVYSLRFEGVYMDSEITLNGEKIFEWKYGYTTFDVPLENVREGENEILVRVRYQAPNTRWYSGAGIYRNIWLRETGKNRIAEDGTYVVSTMNGDSWRTEIDTEILCSTAGTIRHTLLDIGEKDDSKVVAVCETSFPEGTEKVSQSFDIENPDLWSVDRPYLYTLLTELIINDEIVDQRKEHIGYKYVRFDKNEGFFLNGQHLKLNGVCMHHDLGALGAAVNRTATKRQLLSLKEMGVNSIRTSHNPPSVDLMELCDEMGFLVDSEIFDMWELKKTDYDYARFFPEWHERDVRSWIRRDRNHPCIIAWSIGNEIYDTHVSPHGVEITKELIRCVRIDDYKNVHPVTIGSNYMPWEGAQNCAEEIDLVGYNYAEHIYDEHHEKHPDWIIYGSETASTVQSRGIYHFPATVSATTYDDLQCSSLMNCATGWSAPNAEYNIFADLNRKFSLGQYIWTGWDYIGEPTPYSTKNSYFGHSDTAGFPKDTYYAYKAVWNKDTEPFVYLFPYWDFNEGQLVDLFIFSNCAKSELFVNGKSMGTFDHHNTNEKLSGRWQIPYHKGEIKAVGYDENGSKLCEQVRRSFGDPEKIIIKSDKTSLLANGEDMIFVEVSVVDKDGNPVENARNRINVCLSGAGRLMGMDNGDSTDYEQYKCNSRKLFSGRLLIMIGAKLVPGDIELTVSSPELPTEKLSLKAIPAESREGISCIEEISCCADISCSTDASCCADTSCCTDVSCCADTMFAKQKIDINVRKIEMTVSSQLLTPEHPEATAEIKLLPENTTRALSEVGFKAVTDTGVETNLLDITAENGRTVLKPCGDGTYRLRAYLKNKSNEENKSGDKDNSIEEFIFEEIISDIEMENRGFGPASFDPYDNMVLASLCSNSSDIQSAMGGGVLTKQDETIVRFDHVDFGKIGSDELTIGIYTYNENQIPVELLDGDGNLIQVLTFQAENEWNTYKYNTFKLPEKLAGTKGIMFKFSEELRFEGFRFSAPRRTGVDILALENDGVYGDSYTVGSEMIEKIGNNVSILFNDINLGEGINTIEIIGRTRNDRDTLHLKFEGVETQIIEFERSDEIVTRCFDIEPISGKKNLQLVFLPGCDFDLKAIRFIRKEIN